MLAEAQRDPPALPGVSGPGPIVLEVVTSPERTALVSVVHSVDQFSRVARAHAEGPQAQPTLPGDSRSNPRARGVDQHSLATLARVRGPMVLTTSPGRSGLCPMALEVNQLTGGLALTCYSPQGRPVVPCDSGHCAMAPDVNQPSWATHAGVRGPTEFKNCPGRLGIGSVVPRVRPAHSGDSNSGLRARCFD